MSQDFLNNLDIKGQNFISKTRDYLVKRYNQVSKMFSYSTSFGQILLTVSNHSKIVLYYVKDSINEMSFKTARRKESIFGMAQLQGHNASRGMGATGSIKLSPKRESFLNINAPKLYLPNFASVVCVDTNVLYYVSLGKEFIEFDTRSPEDLEFTVHQGVVKSESFQGDGTDNQSYNAGTNRENIDMNHIIVEVNGERYRTVDSFEEFIYGEKTCVVRTGLTAGIDVIFGKSVYSQVPQDGSSIQIFYPAIVGSAGNRNTGLFEMKDPMISSDGQEFDIKEYFDLTVTQPFIFGSDAEDMNITRVIAPNVNRNRIVHDKKSTKYFFQKTNLFANVEVYNNEDPSVMETYLYPRISDAATSGGDIFSVSEEDILLDSNTIERLKDWIDKNRSQNIDVRIKNPTIKNYAIDLILSVRVERQDTIDIDELIKTKRAMLSEGLAKFENTNFIAKSDIIKMTHEGVESVNVAFTVEDDGMLDELGDIVVADKELALPIAPFVSSDGDSILESLNVEVVFI